MALDDTSRQAPLRRAGGVRGGVQRDDLRRRRPTPVLAGQLWQRRHVRPEHHGLARAGATGPAGAGDLRCLPPVRPVQTRLFDPPAGRLRGSPAACRYCCVNERTIILGTPSALQLRMYEVVIGAIEAMMAVARPGITLGELYDAYVVFYDDAGFGGAPTQPCRCQVRMRSDRAAVCLQTKSIWPAATR